ncbi:MAG: hypothetical protein A3D52_00485 [Candidatus Taylorbacteria bacterium RIFCSPHIGHO2_02_FULL_44_36]|nr:MAG: hypothetical protein A3D52_00485 [Candidatus Taylorbacteria bacterium RIFCSPHIGHO2_02_FULL_44_36]
MVPKPKLIFVPHYIGSLLYFEKLLPFLVSRYEVRFLILFIHQGTYREMLDYCRQRNLAYDFLTPPKSADNSKKTNFPVFSLIRDLILYKKQIRVLLNDKQIKEIISVNDGGIYVGYLMTEANKRGIDTAVLQWALAYADEEQRKMPKKIVVFWRSVLYCLAKPVYIFFKKLAVLLILGIYQNKSVLGGGTAKRFGVINQQAFEFFKKQGVPEEKMTVVGYLDFHLAEKTKKDFDDNKQTFLKKALEYNINLSKKNIIVFSSPFYIKDIKIITAEEQVRYYKKLIEKIREICPLEKYDILFKIHPIEDLNTYKSLENIGIKIFDKNADNHALIYLSDLYIADSTTTNFIPITMGKKAIFINFYKLLLVESSKYCFGIKKFATDEKEFNRLLKLYHDRRLPVQYEKDEEIITPDSLTKIIEWIS